MLEPEFPARPNPVDLVKLTTDECEIQTLQSRLGRLDCHDHSWGPIASESFLHLPTEQRWKQRSDECFDPIFTLGLAWYSLRHSPTLATTYRVDPRTLCSNWRTLKTTYRKTD